jgi:Toluene-4-monooxygenase system protein B (TmoB)
MALFPIYGVFKGDFVPHLVAVDTEDTMGQVADKIAVHAVGRRMPQKPGGTYQVQIADKLVDLKAPLSQVMAQTGLLPLQWVTVDWVR